ncbi:MAG: nitroreductase family protein [Arenimonas sp.]|uniref:Acg family FMN-binding oxidoreductase n=1 Tax=Arenimonas sp. TaxID=1872635 RepID=UPI0025BB7AA9|nr:nitroreductase family protein [Arenimonas sp.]MBW8366847.1 nitroreductase family protein [Arenimonas sp.]
MKRRTLLLAGGGLLAAGAAGTALSLRGMGSTQDYAAGAARLREALTAQPGMVDLVRFATLAANSHNTQPWRFRLAPGRMALLPDFARRTPAVDPDDHHMFVSLGCAAANLALAAQARGLTGELRFASGSPDHLVFEHGVGPATASPLFEAIVQRQSTRGEYDGRTASSADLDQLMQAARTPGVELALVTDTAARERIGELVLAGNSAQMADPAFVSELRQWLRFNPREALSSGDGLYAACSGNPIGPSWLAPTLFKLFFKEKTENDKYARQLRSAAGLAVFSADKDDPEHWLRVGQACQRFALQATALGMKHAFLNQPAEVPSLRAELAALAGFPGRRPNLLMRFGYGPGLPYSLRRSAASVIEPA